MRTLSLAASRGILGAPRRNTIDVEMDWIELVDDDGNVVKQLAEKK